MPTIISKRPNWNQEMKVVLSKTAGKLINEWCNNKISLQDCIERSERVLEYNHNRNGYDLAKAFEEEGFSPDSELVSLMEFISFEKYNIRESFVKKWVSENSLKLELVEGQNVIAKLIGKGEVQCEIVKLYPETMQYGLWYEASSYKRGKGHTIVDFENVKLN